jgi:hypothetical protein
MRTLAKTVALLLLTLWPALGAADDSNVVTKDDVLAMMAKLPGVNRAGAPAYAWDRTQYAGKIADAIVQTAPTRTWAARMVVYAVRESGLQICAVGDGGLSLGPWQLQGVPRTVACEPKRAAPVWLAKARIALADCAKLPEKEQLAELVSGSCDKGRKLASDRESWVEKLSAS